MASLTLAEMSIGLPTTPKGSVLASAVLLERMNEANVTANAATALRLKIMSSPLSDVWGSRGLSVHPASFIAQGNLRVDLGELLLAICRRRSIMGPPIPI